MTSCSRAIYLVEIDVEPLYERTIAEALKLLEEITREGRYSTDPRSGEKQEGHVGRVVEPDEIPEDPLSGYLDENPEGAE
jgi:hypothetical protein